MAGAGVLGGVDVLGDDVGGGGFEGGGDAAADVQAKIFQ